MQVEVHQFRWTGKSKITVRTGNLAFIVDTIQKLYPNAAVSQSQLVKDGTDGSAEITAMSNNLIRPVVKVVLELGR